MKTFKEQFVNSIYFIFSFVCNEMNIRMQDDLINSALILPCEITIVAEVAWFLNKLTKTSWLELLRKPAKTAIAVRESCR